MADRQTEGQSFSHLSPSQDGLKTSLTSEDFTVETTYNLLFVDVRWETLGQNRTVLQENFGDGL